MTEHKAECMCELDGFLGAVTSQNCTIHMLPSPESKGMEEETALQSFANWLKDVPKDTKVKVTQSEKTIVFTIIN